MSTVVPYRFPKTVFPLHKVLWTRSSRVIFCSHGLRCQKLDQFLWNYAAESIQSFCTFLCRIQHYTVRSETVPTHNIGSLSLSLSLSHARTYTSTHSHINTIRLKQVLVVQVWMLCSMFSLVPVCDRNRVKRKTTRDSIPEKSNVPPLYDVVSVKDTRTYVGLETGNLCFLYKSLADSLTVLWFPVKIAKPMWIS